MLFAISDETFLLVRYIMIPKLYMGQPMLLPDYIPHGPF